jgi:alpha-tubulin suppressor-like RCC1 family protein
MATIADIPKECSCFGLQGKTRVRLRRFVLHGFVMSRWLKCTLQYSRRIQKTICISVGSTETLAGMSVTMCFVNRRLGLSATPSTGTQFLPKQISGIHEQVTSVALGQDHTIVITKSGALYTWGSNQHGQLGYSLDLSTNKDNVQRIPRKIVAPLKRIEILGVAASNVHSVCFSKEDLYTWGLNRGQLGYSAGDEGPIQSIPRKVASLPSQVEMVTAIDNATICLLKNKTVMIFANNGYFRVK